MDKLVGWMFILLAIFSLIAILGFASSIRDWAIMIGFLIIGILKLVER